MSGALLIQAIKDENIATVRANLENGASVDYMDELGIPALHWAIAGHNMPIINLLLERGASIELENADHETALHTAIDHNNSDLVTRFLAAGTDPNHKDITGMSVLQAACALGRLPIVELLLQGGANVDLEYGPEEANNGSNNSGSNSGSNAGNGAVNGQNGQNGQQGQNQENDEEEEEEEEEEEPDSALGNTALHFAAASGRLSIVRRLLEAGANRYHTNTLGETPWDTATPAIRDYFNQLPQQAGKRRHTRRNRRVHRSRRRQRSRRSRSSRRF